MDRETVDNCIRAARNSVFVRWSHSEGGVVTASSRSNPNVTARFQWFEDTKRGQVIYMAEEVTRDVLFNLTALDNEELP